MEIIRTEIIGNCKNLTLIYFECSKSYDIQLTDEDNILRFDEGYCNKKDALKVYKAILKNFNEQYMIISNFIERFTSDDNKRNNMKRYAEDYLWEEE